MSTTIQPYTGMILFGVQSAWKDDYVAPYLLHDTPTPCKIFSVTPTYG